MGDDLSYGLNTLGPLCLWQCFFLNIVKNIEVEGCRSVCYCDGKPYSTHNMELCCTFNGEI